MEGARGRPIELHECLASNLHSGHRQLCAPFPMLVNRGGWSEDVRSAIDHASAPCLPKPVCSIQRGFRRRGRVLADADPQISATALHHA